MNKSYTLGAQQLWRQKLLLLNGGFLLAAGGAALSAELLAHFAGIGPQKAVFERSPYTIGFAEAHGLAFLSGLQLLRASRGQQPRRSWHLHATLIHLLLGGSNLLFWRSFVHFNLIPVGVVTTILHGFFAITQSMAFFSARAAKSPVATR